jgi:hypothetical protein
MYVSLVLERLKFVCSTDMELLLALLRVGRCTSIVPWKMCLVAFSLKLVGLWVFGFAMSHAKLGYAVLFEMPKITETIGRHVHADWANMNWIFMKCQWSGHTPFRHCLAATDGLWSCGASVGCPNIVCLLAIQ